ncbi:Rhythmically expressed gene 2 protein [Gryllus bimaculatus]|nr:Rhythmically expressed gene 2 protein [Gryllus bimaculatus]
MKFAGAFQLVTFDATGTLMKFRISPPEQYAIVGSMYGVEVNVKDITSNFKLNWKLLNKEHPNFGKMSGLGWEKWWYELVCRTFRASTTRNSFLEASKLDLIAQHLIKGYSSGSYYELYPHVKEVMENLQKQKIILGVLSNNDERLISVLEHLGLLPYFNFVFTSYNVGYEKPHCEIFQKALQCSKVLPEHALHVGNSPVLDYFAAIKCGWNAALIHQEQKDLEQYNSEIPSHLIFKNFLNLQHFLC